MSIPRVSRIESRPDGAERRGKLSLKLWLRLLACENMVEHDIRGRLRTAFGVTLPQFDVLSELEHAGHALTMSELSRELMVSNGNITGVIDRLERDGMVSRRPSETDRRVQYIELTEPGLERFRDMAREHENWLQQLFGGLSTTEIKQLENLLREAKVSIRTALSEDKT
ncbi:MAG: MarR family transcriptional regulator [Gammaproteobacteria bacterium]|nr:MarR family transcriptional regulator [Gammaproteobacteria bacterium]NNM00705.1 MarR family transcriptional regulator [Gammaproteobacteria bacterium]